MQTLRKNFRKNCQWTTKIEDAVVYGWGRQIFPKSPKKNQKFIKHVSCVFFKEIESQMCIKTFHHCFLNMAKFRTVSRMRFLWPHMCYIHRLSCCPELIAFQIQGLRASSPVNIGRCCYFWVFRSSATHRQASLMFLVHGQLFFQNLFVGIALGKTPMLVQCF